LAISKTEFKEVLSALVEMVERVYILMEPNSKGINLISYMLNTSVFQDSVSILFDQALYFPQLLIYRKSLYEYGTNLSHYDWDDIPQ